MCSRLVQFWSGSGTDDEQMSTRGLQSILSLFNCSRLAAIHDDTASRQLDKRRTLLSAQVGIDSVTLVLQHELCNVTSDTSTFCLLTSLTKSTRDSGHLVHICTVYFAPLPLRYIRPVYEK